jgi:hypothetical protein
MLTELQPHSRHTLKLRGRPRGKLRRLTLVPGKALRPGKLNSKLAADASYGPGRNARETCLQA